MRDGPARHGTAGRRRGRQGRNQTSSVQEQRKPIFLYFTDVKEADLARAAQLESKLEVKRLLQDCMKIDQAAGFRTEILADMHYHNYVFCLSRGFSPSKTSTLLSIMRLVLEEAVKQRLAVDDAFDVFKDWLLKHSVERPPRSVGIFAFEDVKAIMDYMHNTFFRHYSLYVYVFMTHMELRLRVDDTSLCIAPPVTRPSVLRPEDEVEAKSQPELAHIFRPSEAELAEAELRRLREGDPPKEDKATIIKRRVDQGVKELVESFEQKLQDQDVRYKAVLET